MKCSIIKHQIIQLVTQNMEATPYDLTKSLSKATVSGHIRPFINDTNNKPNLKKNLATTNKVECYTFVAYREQS